MLDLNRHARSPTWLRLGRAGDRGAKLGFAPVHAVDAERAAVEATKRNAVDNGVALDSIGAAISGSKQQ